MPDNVAPPQPDSSARLKKTLYSIAKIVLLALTLTLAGIAAITFLGEEETEIPFQYDGFD